jgi:hypothetical protein
VSLRNVNEQLKVSSFKRHMLFTLDFTVVKEIREFLKHSGAVYGSSIPISSGHIGIDVSIISNLFYSFFSGCKNHNKIRIIETNRRIVPWECTYASSIVRYCCNINF